MHICPCSWAVGICKQIWIQTYFGPVMVDSEEVFRHFVFMRAVVPIPAVASASVLQSAAVGGSVVGVVGPL